MHALPHLLPMMQLMADDDVVDMGSSARTVTATTAGTTGSSPSPTGTSPVPTPPPNPLSKAGSFARGSPAGGAGGPGASGASGEATPRVQASDDTQDLWSSDPWMLAAMAAGNDPALAKSLENAVS